MIQTKKQAKTPEEEINKVMVNSLSNKDFKVIIRKRSMTQKVDWMNTMRIQQRVRKCKGEENRVQE